MNKLETISWVFLMVAIVTLASCGGRHAVNGSAGPQGESGLDGQDGAPGKDGSDAVAELIDPCGDNPGHFDEILIRYDSGELVAYFQHGSKRFLTILTPGRYQTTDEQRCYFTVDSELAVTWDD